MRHPITIDFLALSFSGYRSIFDVAIHLCSQFHKGKKGETAMFGLLQYDSVQKDIRFVQREDPSRAGAAQHAACDYCRLKKVGGCYSYITFQS
jgi:hypothetical protein